MKPIKLRINTKTQNYSIIIGINLVNNISKILEQNSINFKQCLLIVDKNISKNIFIKLKNHSTKKNFMYIFLKQMKSIKV